MSEVRASHALVAVSELYKSFPLKAGLFARSAARIHAVNGVSFEIERGRTLGLVGESGCGKTTTARLLLRIHEPDRGGFWFDVPSEVRSVENDFFRLGRAEMVKSRLRMQYIFQDPYGSLNPKMQVLDLVSEPFRQAQGASRARSAERARELLDLVGLSAGDLHKYPHEFSGGQRQRLSIARALSAKPDFVICDEPVSSLDVSVQSQILNLLNELQKELGLTYLFIGHNFPVVFYMSDEVAVMYAGKLVEYAPTRTLSARPLHPYTRLLMESAKAEKPDAPAEAGGEVPSLLELPAGCPFAPRCPLAIDECRTTTPPLEAKAPGHLAACLRVPVEQPGPG